MKGSHSRLLQVVVAATLLNVTPDGRATTYDDTRVGVRPPEGYRDYTSSFDDGYNDWYSDDNYDDSFASDDGERSGSDGVDDPDEPEAPDAEKQAECEAIAARVPADCNVDAPPLLTTNGCGGGMFAGVVPDYLIVQGAAVTRLGPIFTSACNAHDRCYGTYPADKVACDEELRGNMVSVIYDQFSPTQQFAYGNYVVTQADLYSDTLQGSALSIARGFFEAGQTTGACRSIAKEAEDAGCLE